MQYSLYQMAIIPFKLIRKLLRLNGMSRIERLARKGWAVKSAGMLSNAGGVAKKTEDDEARVGSMVLECG
jgi:hypothetical protein